MRCLVRLAVVLVVVSAGLVPAASTAAGQSNLLVQPAGFDRTGFTITVYENGSADWTIRHSRRLDNGTERDQFEAFAERFRTQETELYTDFVGRARRLVAIGQNRTGREMNATAFSRDAHVNVTSAFADRGTVELSFRWTAFAQVRSDRVVVSDVFEGALYIGPNQSLTFQRGPDLVFAGVDPEPSVTSDPDSLVTSESVTWQGPREFSSARPYVEFAPRAAVPGVTATTAAGTDAGGTAAGGPGAGETTAGPGETTAPAASAGGATPWSAIAAFVALLLVGAALLAYRSAGLPWSGDAGATTDTADQGARSESGAPEQEPKPEPAPEPDPVPEAELLSDSDRVLKLLEEHGGRMKQVNIVEETDWSKSKVSMLLSDMEEEGEISKLRVGRENIISLAGEEPDAAGSPFDEE